MTGPSNRVKRVAREEVPWLKAFLYDGVANDFPEDFR
jgi:hypothetical protein